jgi:hypothetical protein
MLLTSCTDLKIELSLRSLSESSMLNIAAVFNYLTSPVLSCKSFVFICTADVTLLLHVIIVKLHTYTAVRICERAL